MGLRATVRNGRLVVDEEIKLPEGTELELVLDDEGDDLDERERAALNASIAISLEQEARGEVKPMEQVRIGLVKVACHQDHIQLRIFLQQRSH